MLEEEKPRDVEGVFTVYLKIEAHVDGPHGQHTSNEERPIGTFRLRSEAREFFLEMLTEASVLCGERDGGVKCICPEGSLDPRCMLHAAAYI